MARTDVAADTGVVDMSQEVISVAGTDEGADTAIVLVPAFSRGFKELEILEVLAKPRQADQHVSDA